MSLERDRLRNALFFQQSKVERFDQVSRYYCESRFSVTRLLLALSERLRHIDFIIRIPTPTFVKITSNRFCQLSHFLMVFYQIFNIDRSSFAHQDYIVFEASCCNIQFLIFRLCKEQSFLEFLKLSLESSKLATTIITLFFK